MHLKILLLCVILSTLEALKCRCRHGMASMENNCTPNNRISCKFCDSGYHLIKNKKLNRSGRCYKNVCGCPNGVPNINQRCVQHKQISCVGCNTGYHLLGSWNNGASCVQNKCRCKHGVEAVGEECYRDGAQHCVGCNENYRLEKSLYAENSVCLWDK